MMNKEAAETIALQALGFIVGDDDLLDQLVSVTGVGIDDLRSDAGDPDFLAGVLDFLLLEDKRLLNFCESAGIKPEEPKRARQALPGGQFVE